MSVPLPLTLRRQNLTLTAMLALVHTSASAALHDSRAQFFHPEEAAVYESLPAPSRRQSFLLGRYAAKQALSALLHEPDWTRLHIVPGVFTQPTVAYATPEPVEVSITHAGDLAAALAFPQRHPMGLDVERLQDRSLDAMRSQIVDAEWHAPTLQVVPALLRATLLWTAKEALSKVLKCGMMCPFALFETSEVEQDGGRYGGQFRHFGQYQFQSWVVQGHVLSLVLPKWTTLDIDLTAWTMRP